VLRRSAGGASIVIMVEDVRETPPSDRRGGTRTPQDALIEQATRVLSLDRRVIGVWLAGSYGRGTQDAFSDVDLWVVVTAAEVDGFCRDWPSIAEEIAPTVLHQQVGDKPVFTQVTPDWLRFDVTIATPSDVPGRSRTTVRPLYDPTGLSGRLADPRPPLQPDPDRVRSLGREFLRVLGLLPVAMGREEYVVGQSGAQLLRSMLISLMLEDVAVEDRGGALHLNTLLPADRRQILADLPPLMATRESVIATHVACAAAFLPLARELHQRCGIDWPQELEDAARRHLAGRLGVELA
jgi:predicted nucleotidyltransferase